MDVVFGDRLWLDSHSFEHVEIKEVLCLRRAVRLLILILLDYVEDGDWLWHKDLLEVVHFIVSNQ